MKIQFHWLLLAALAPGLASCAVLAAPRQTAFNDADFAPYRAVGTATVGGRMVIRDGAGDTRAGNQDHVILLPVTAYTEETVRRELVEGQELISPDRGLSKYRRVAKCDTDGNFLFDHVPVGRYFLIGLVSWSVDLDNFDYQWACERIKVTAGQTLRTELTHNPLGPHRIMLVIPPTDL